MVAVDGKLMRRRKRMIGRAVERDSGRHEPAGSFCRGFSNSDTTAVVTYNATTQTWGVAQRYVYSPYGSILILNSDFSTPPSGTQPISDYLYQGMTLDSITGLYYARNRNYGPSLGIWISQDPLGYLNGANTYQMEMSSPVGAVDPWGHQAFTFRSEYWVNINQAGVSIAPPGRMPFHYMYSFDYFAGASGYPIVSGLHGGRFWLTSAPFGLGHNPVNVGIGVGPVNTTFGYFGAAGILTTPLPAAADGSHSVLVMVQTHFWYDVGGGLSAILAGVSADVTGTHYTTGVPLGGGNDFFEVTQDCHGTVTVVALGPMPLSGN
ncbi:MAG: RHS repeat-associated core domain-containing protein [Phycisphaerales bacterium]|nr:RHS repeat-associated core domain-containing protein [Phycisphaerales bacterium]